MSLTKTKAATLQSNFRLRLAGRLQDLFFSQRSLQPRHWFLSTAIACLVLPATTATVCYSQQSGGPVGTGQPLNRIGRVLGIGYSDGYHAGQQGQSNLLLDLPPRSLWADPRYAGQRHGHHRMMTYEATDALPAWFQPHVHQGPPAVDPYAEAIMPIESVETYRLWQQAEPSPSAVLPDPLIDDNDKSEADSSTADPLSGSLLPADQTDPLRQEQSLEKMNTLENPKAGGNLLLEPDANGSADPLNDFTMNRPRPLRFPSPAATLSNIRLQNSPSVTPPPAPAARQPRTASRIAEPSPVPK